MTEQCSNCRFARPIPQSDTGVVCQRYPPTVFSVVGQNVSSCSPYVNSAYWCGEWRANDIVQSETDKAIRKTRKPHRPGDI
jgi:hypothetical protein